MIAIILAIVMVLAWFCLVISGPNAHKQFWALLWFPLALTLFILTWITVWIATGRYIDVEV